MRHKERNQRQRVQRSKRLRVAKWPSIRYVMVFYPQPMPERKETQT